jgi:hypothetical protein
MRVLWRRVRETGPASDRSQMSMAWFWRSGISSTIATEAGRP